MPLSLAEAHAAPPEQAAPLHPRQGWTDRALYAAVTLLILLASLLHRTLVGPPVFPMDDAYITLHNAQVLHWGHDPNYPGTPALAGATSAVHLALVALLIFILSPPVALGAALWVATLAYALGLVRLARVHEGTPAQALLLTLVGLAAGQVPHQLMNGLETGLTLAAVTWVLVLASEPGRMGPGGGRAARAPWGVAAVPVWGAAVHPAGPGAALAGPAGGPPCVRGRGLAWGGGAPSPPRPWTGGTVRRPVGALVRGQSGTRYPGTVEAKRLFFAQAGRPAPIKAQIVWKHLTFFAGDLGLVTLSTLLLGRKAIGRVGLLFALALVATYFLHFPDALGFYEGRYLYSLLPLVLYGAASAFKVWPRGTRPVLRAAVTGLLAAALVQSYWRAPDF